MLKALLKPHHLLTFAVAIFALVMIATMDAQADESITIRRDFQGGKQFTVEQPNSILAKWSLGLDGVATEYILTYKGNAGKDSIIVESKVIERTEAGKVLRTISQSDNVLPVNQFGDAIHKVESLTFAFRQSNDILTFMILSDWSRTYSDLASKSHTCNRGHRYANADGDGCPICNGAALAAAQEK